VAVLSTEVVRIEPNFTGFRTKLEAGVTAATRGVVAKVRVVPVCTAAPGFKALKTQIRDCVNEATKGITAKVPVEAVYKGRAGYKGLSAQLTAAAKEVSTNAKPLTVKVEADCKHLIRQLRDCLRQGGYDLAHVAEQREARQAARDAERAAQNVQREAERRQRAAARAAATAERDAHKRRLANLKAFRDALSGGGGAGQDLFGGIVDLGRRGVRPMNLLIGAVVAMGPALIAMAASAAKASTVLVAFGAAALGAASGIGVLAFAFRGLGDALKLHQQAAEGSETAAAELDATLRAMTPAARALFGELLAIRREMSGFARLAQQEVLPGFTAFLRLVREAPRGGASTVDILKMGMLDLGDIISMTTARMGVFAASEFFKGHLAAITNENTAAFQNLADAALALLRPITRLISAAAPQLTRFTEYLEKLAQRFSAWIDSFSDADLAQFFREAGDELARWGKLAGNLLDLLLGIGRASADAGGQFVDRLGNWVGTMADWVNGPGFDKVQGFFTFLADLPWAKIGAGLAGIGAGFATIYASRLVGIGGGGGGGMLEGLLGLFGKGAAGAAAPGVGMAAMLLLPKLLGSIKLGLFGLGAGFTYLYVTSDKFRNTVNQIVTLFVEEFLPPVKAGFAVLLGTIEANKEEFVALAVAAADLAKVLAPIAGKALGQGFQAMAITLAATIKLQVEMARMFFVVSAASAASASAIISAYQAASAVVFAILRNIGATAARLLRAVGLDNSADLVDAVVGGLAGVQREINGIAEDGKRVLDDWSAYAQRTLAEMAGATARTGQGTFARNQGGIAGAVANAGELAAAQAALDAAQKASAASAKQWAEALALAGREIRDAQIDVREALLGARDARQGMRDAAYAVADARKAIVAGQTEEKEAQQEITAARRDAADAIVDLRAQIKGLAVDEGEARYKLLIAKEVRKGFQYAQGIDPLLRKRLDLDVAAAEQGLSEIIAEGTKARRELTDAERKGIERSDQVVAAKKRLKDVQEQNVQRQRDLIRAQEDEVRAAESVRRATEGVRTATERLTDATRARTRSSQESAAAAASEAKAVEAARKKYGDLKTAIEAVPQVKPSIVKVIPQVVGKAPGTSATITITGPLAKPRKPTGQVQDRQQRTATGGPIYGGGDGLSDSVPIWASKGEFMQPRSAVNYYGSAGMEAIRRRAVPRNALAGYAAGGQILTPPVSEAIGQVMAGQHAYHYAGKIANYLGARMKLPSIINQFLVPLSGFTGGVMPPGGLPMPGVGAGKWPLGGPWPATPWNQRGDSGIWHGIMSLVKATGLPYSFGNAYRHGDPKWHGSGRAVDLMGFNQDALASYFMSIKPNVLELIHRSNTRDYGVSRGQNNYMGEALYNQHRNHLHIAMDSGGILPPGVTVVHNRTGKPETVRTAEQEGALRYVRLDTRDLKRLAAYIAVATDRPIDIDGRRVAEAVTSYSYLPAGGL
jgi:hypothetical protein